MSTVKNKKSVKMKVNNVSFMIERLGKDCGPLQFLRELTQNSLESIQRNGNKGSIFWDVDWNYFDLTGIKKLSICDNGDGMSATDMVNLMGQLSSSGSEQSLTKNYGIGAKISTMSRNTAGVQYQSWKNSEGFMINLRKEEDEYALQQYRLANGDFYAWFPLRDEVKPKSISEHGTKVTLLGNNESEDTMQAPEGAQSPSRWVSKYLNSRYYIIPESVKIYAREGWDFPREDKDRNTLRQIIGQKSYLDKHSQDNGLVQVKGALIRWWILKDEPAIKNNSGYIESAGHVAAIYQNELFNQCTGKKGIQMLQNFGVLFGGRRVIIYVEPESKSRDQLVTNTARTALLLNDSELPWSDWQIEFNAKMPEILQKFVEEQGKNATTKDRSKTVREKLSTVMHLYKVSRYRPNENGASFADPNAQITMNLFDISNSDEKDQSQEKENRDTINFPVSEKDKAGNVYSLYEKKDGVRATETKADNIPEVVWVSQKDGTRSSGEMEDRAACYVANSNTIKANSDFRIFKDLTNFLSKERGTKVKIQPIVEEQLRSCFDLSLVQAVMGIQQLKGSKEWGPDELDAALSEEALTATVMLRYHVIKDCRLSLQNKLGRIKNSEGIQPEEVINLSI